MHLLLKIPVRAIWFLTLALILANCQDRSSVPGAAGSSTRVVQADGGLRMRGTPDLTGKVLLLIPDASEVTMVEEGAMAEVGGKKGRWVRVRFGNLTGWVFGAFLSDRTGPH